MSLQPTVVIITEDAEFSRLLSARWQSERKVPELTIASCNVGVSGRPGFDLAVIGPVPGESLKGILGAIHGSVQSVMVLADGLDNAARIRSEYPRVLVLPKHEGWLDTLVMFAAEILRRVEAQNRASRAEATQTVL